MSLELKVFGCAFYMFHFLNQIPISIPLKKFLVLCSCMRVLAQANSFEEVALRRRLTRVRHFGSRPPHSRWVMKHRPWSPICWVSTPAPTFKRSMALGNSGSMNLISTERKLHWKLPAEWWGNRDSTAAASGFVARITACRQPRAVSSPCSL